MKKQIKKIKVYPKIEDVLGHMKKQCEIIMVDIRKDMDKMRKNLCDTDKEDE